MFTEKDIERGRELEKECVYLIESGALKHLDSVTAQLITYLTIKLAQLENQIEELRNKDGN